MLVKSRSACGSSSSAPAPVFSTGGMRRALTAAAIAAAAALPAVLAGAQAPPPAISVKLGTDGRLAYSADAAGNRAVDYSHAGYGGGGVALPDVPARLVVGPGGERDGLRIQTAIDAVSALPLDADGFRGAGSSGSWRCASRRKGPLRSSNG